MKVRVSVIDNGPGIPEEEQQRIFDKFYQVDAGHTRESTGTGLGLAICRELAHVLNCEIQLVSGVNRGSMFSLIMPLTLVPSHAAEAALEARLRGTLSGGRSWSGDRE
jgi:signal transduction histidine kinase